MSGFALDWLASREPADGEARSAELAAAFADAVPAGGLIVDLGAGSGSNARYLDRFVGARARWRLVDDDAALLAASGRANRRLDLAREIDAALADASAVTASALMDLVSASWTDRLARHLAQRRLPALFALSVDGRHALDPIDADDAAIWAAFACDQARDKGFGPALGAKAPKHMRATFENLGARVRLGASDWRLGAHCPALLRGFIDGLAAAAAAQGVASQAWRKRRARQIDDGALGATVGHQDLLVLW